MKENGELTREDIMIESDMEVADDNENQIVVYVETWFDVDQNSDCTPVMTQRPGSTFMPDMMCRRTLCQWSM